MGTWRTSLRGWAVDLAIATAGGLFFGLIGPFGSYRNGPPWERVAFQVICFWVGVILYGGGARLVLRLRLSGLWPWAAIIAMVAVVNAPFSLFVAALGRAFWPIVSGQGAIEWYLQGLVTAEPIVLAMAYLIHRREFTPQPQAKPQAPRHEGLLGVATSEVICLQMEDHYVRVHTGEGSRLVHATLSQAVAAMGGVQGLQVHRSWWVASRSVEAVETHGRNLRLRLSNGVRAPVARSAVPAVRAAGWIGEGRSDTQLEGA